jgi:teichuronic acid biosynthesis glycosyltransferase TuaC
MEKMNVLSISTMFPSANDPIFGIFVKRRLTALSKIVNLTIASPRPYFPFITMSKKYESRKNEPYEENITDKTKVYFPRFLSFPMILKPLDGFFLFLTVFIFILKIRAKGIKFDIFDAHIAYPDGFAAVMLGKIFKVPVTITLRGHDVNYLPRYPIRKKQVIYALKKANKVFSVANALRLQAGELGIDINKITVASNGVEASIFAPMDQKQVRKELGLEENKTILLSIGYLVPRKGFDLLIDALRIIINKYSITNTKLVIVGGRGGEEYIKDKLISQIKRLDLDNDVLFVDAKKNEDLVKWYNCSDVFCLASSLEGWPNVILESLACSIPVVATNIWGIPEIIGNDTELGVLVDRNVSCIADGIHTALKKSWNKKYIRDFALTKTWDDTAILIKREMEKVIR